MTDTPIAPRILPHDLADAATTLAASTLQIAVLFGIPAGIAFLATGDVALSLTVAAWAYGIFLLFTVARLVITPAGIQVARLCGSPKFIKWEDVTEIRIAPRQELLLRGWAWPLFPMREMTPSLSSVGHYRIGFGTRSIYFPPQDPKLFLAAIAPYLPVAPAAASAG